MGVQTRSGVASAVRTAAALAVLLLGAAQVDAKKKSQPAEDPTQKAYEEMARPGIEHARLAKRAGTWEVVVKSFSGGEADPAVHKLTSVFTMDMGERFLIEKIEGAEAGRGVGRYRGMVFIGFNNGLKRFEYAWIDNTGTAIVNGVGTLNSKGDLEWTSQVYDPVQKTTVRMREAERTLPDGSFVRETFAPGAGGKDEKVLEQLYTRK